MVKKIIIVGAGQNGQAAQNIFSLDKNNIFFGFLDDNIKAEGKILGPIESFTKYKSDYYFFISMGNNIIRKKFFNLLKEEGVKFINSIHPRSYIEKDVVIGENIMVGAFAYINTKCVIGDNTIINTGSIIEHHSKIGSHSHIAPGVTTAGEVSVGNGVFIGIGSTLRDRIKIGNNSFFGASSNIVAHTEENAMYYGNPAKFIKYLE